MSPLSHHRGHHTPMTLSSLSAEVSVWRHKISEARRKLKKLCKRQREDTVVERMEDIPRDWQNTLVRSYPSLHRATTSSSSFASSSSSSSSSNSSSYSVSDFLRDLATSEHIQSKHHSKTSIPKQFRKSKEKLLETNLDLTRMKIYDEEVSLDAVYENGKFLRAVEDTLQNLLNEQDLDDGYEIILVNNQNNNCRNLKHLNRK